MYVSTILACGCTQLRLVEITMRIGLHLSIRDSLDRTVDRAVERGCNTMQIFSRNPRGWSAKKLDAEVVRRFKVKLRKSEVWPVYIHTPYLLNLASPKRDVYKRSLQALQDELQRAGMLGVPFVVTHLGSHLGHGKEGGCRRIISAITTAFTKVENDVTLLLENTAGTRNSMGSSFEDIQRIVSSIEERNRVGVCFDTCHAFATGYDLVSRRAIRNTLQKFDNLIGLDALMLVHLNDSKGGLRSKLDRHEHIGLGKIGEKGFKNLLESKLGQVPLILETPIDNRRDDVDNLRKVWELSQKS